MPGDKESAGGDGVNQCQGDGSFLPHAGRREESNRRNEAVRRLVKQVIDAAHRHKPRRKIGICGQAPSDFPEFADYLVRCGIDSMSLNPDVVLSTRLDVTELEKRIKSKTGRKRT